MLWLSSPTWPRNAPEAGDQGPSEVQEALGRTYSSSARSYSIDRFCEADVSSRLGTSAGRNARDEDRGGAKILSEGSKSACSEASSSADRTSGAPELRSR